MFFSLQASLSGTDIIGLFKDAVSAEKVTIATTVYCALRFCGETEKNNENFEDNLYSGKHHSS
jgi:hypothetical protein